MRFSFLTKIWPSSFPTLDLPVFTQHHFATQPWYAPLYNARLLTKRTSHAVREARQQSVLCKWPSSVSEKLRLDFFKKFELQFFANSTCSLPHSAALPHTLGTHHPTVHKCWQSSNGTQYGDHVSRVFCIDGRGQLHNKGVQVFEKKLNFNFSKVGPAHWQLPLHCRAPSAHVNISPRSYRPYPSTELKTWSLITSWANSRLPRL